MQVMTNETEDGERLRQSIKQKTSEDAAISAEAAFLKKRSSAADNAILRYLSDGKSHKPN
jgi:hypothetical protein